MQKSRNWKHSRQYSVWTWFNAYVTNADKNMILSEAIAEIYKYRWQIELVFKTWKSNYYINKFKSMKVERMECYLYALLLKAAIHRNVMNLCYKEQGVSFIKLTKLAIAFDKKIHAMIKNPIQTVEGFITTISKLGNYILMKEIKKKTNIFVQQVSKAQLTSSKMMGIKKYEISPYRGNEPHLT